MLGYFYRQPEAVVNHISYDDPPQDWEMSDEDIENILDENIEIEMVQNIDNGEPNGEDRDAVNPRGFHGVSRAAWSDQRPSDAANPSRQGDSNRVPDHVVRPRCKSH